MYKALKPLANYYAKACGYRKVGLRYDDLLIEEREDMQKVSVGCVDGIMENCYGPLRLRDAGGLLWPIGTGQSVAGLW